MSYSDKEIAQIRKDVLLIKDYIDSIRKDIRETIIIPISHVKYKAQLVVTPFNGVYTDSFQIGDNYYNLDRFADDHNLYKNEDLCMVLITHWQDIKNYLINEIHVQVHNTEHIFNFEV